MNDIEKLISLISEGIASRMNGEDAYDRNIPQDFKNPKYKATHFSGIRKKDYFLPDELIEKEGIKRSDVDGWYIEIFINDKSVIRSFCELKDGENHAEQKAFETLLYWIGDFINRKWVFSSLEQKFNGTTYFA